MLSQRIADLPRGQAEDARRLGFNPPGPLHGVDDFVPVGAQIAAARTEGFGGRRDRCLREAGRGLARSRSRRRDDRQRIDDAVRGVRGFAAFPQDGGQASIILAGEIYGLDLVTRREGRRAAHAVLKLANVAGEFAVRQHRDRGGGERQVRPLLGVESP